MSAKSAQSPADENDAAMSAEPAAAGLMRWESERLDLAADQAIAACGGDMRSAIRALILANEFLQQEMRAQVSNGYKRGYDRGRWNTYSG